MTMTNVPHITRGGVPGFDHVPFGMHACHFYADRSQLVAAQVPYFAGLRANERCLWVTAPPLRAREAVQALRAAWEGADDAIQAGTLRVLDFDRWYASSAGLKGIAVVELWLKEEERALEEGYNGLGVSGNTRLPDARQLVHVHGVRTGRDRELQQPAHRRALQLPAGAVQ
jgi:hypothetical protein